MTNRNAREAIFEGVSLDESADRELVAMNS